MEVMIFIGVLVFAVAMATMIQQRFLQKISVNYIALVIGMAIALVPQTNLLIENFNSEVFLGLIVARSYFLRAKAPGYIVFYVAGVQSLA